jgi:hypothetical protein
MVRAVPVKLNSPQASSSPPKKKAVPKLDGILDNMYRVNSTMGIEMKVEEKWTKDDMALATRGFEAYITCIGRDESEIVPGHGTLGFVGNFGINSRQHGLINKNGKEYSLLRGSMRVAEFVDEEPKVTVSPMSSFNIASKTPP